MEGKISASQLKHCTGAYDGYRAEWMDNWIITALMEPWENWSTSLLCSRLQLCLLPEVEVAEPHGGIVLALTALLLSKHPKCSSGTGKFCRTGMDWLGSTSEVQKDLISLLMKDIEAELRLCFGVNVV